ncbi:MAG: SRPBCC family protein [Thermoanaerobaculia bacterium]
MFKKIVTVVVVLVAALLIFAATKPDTLRVERTASIKAPPEKIFPLVNDFHNWSSWSPWEKRDPAMKRTYSGAAVGKGAVYEWDGNNQVGKGRMEITDTTAPSRITIKLDFMEPLEGHDIAEYTLEPQGDSTKVTWVMHGPNRFIGKVISVFISGGPARRK